MSSMPTSITELAQRWSQLLQELTDENNEQIAYQMVGILVCNNELWMKWYESGKEPLVNAIFDNVADLELPDGINVADDAERQVRWRQVRTSAKILEQKYLNS